MGARVPVQEEDGWAASSDAKPDRTGVDMHGLKFEAAEHLHVTLLGSAQCAEVRM